MLCPRVRLAEPIKAALIWLVRLAAVKSSVATRVQLGESGGSSDVDSSCRKSFSSRVLSLSLLAGSGALAFHLMVVCIGQWLEVASRCSALTVLADRGPARKARSSVFPSL